MYSLDDVNPRDIILADPKYPDQNKEKTRPLLVISKPLFQQNSRFCICLGLTTSNSDDPYAIPIKQKDVENGQLDMDVKIVCRRIVALRYDKVLKKIGTKVNKEVYEKVMKKLLDDVIEIKS